jgi:hypothetical protein
MSNGYEIRHGLLSEAKDVLMQEWHIKWDAELRTAEREDRSPTCIPLPTSAEIIKLANEWYDFVQTKDARPGPGVSYTQHPNVHYQNTHK